MERRDQPMYELYIANKNYSSWSLRPWVLMGELGSSSRSTCCRSDRVSRWEAFRKISPARQSAVLGRWRDGRVGIARHRRISRGKTRRRLAAGFRRAGMGSKRRGRDARRLQRAAQPLFDELRRARPAQRNSRRVLERDIDRVGALWNDGLRRFGGPFLAGGAFTAVDAFFAPVAYRIQTYGLTLEPRAAEYATAPLGSRVHERLVCGCPQGKIPG